MATPSAVHTPVTARFVNEVCHLLPDGAGHATFRAASTFEAADRTDSQESRRYYVLLNRAVLNWATAALERGGSEATLLGLRSLGGVHDASDAGYHAQMLNTYRRRLEAQPGTDSARRVLLLVEKALKIAAAHDGLWIPADQRIRGVSLCAEALVTAFQAGFVDAVPTVTAAVAQQLVETA